MELTSSTLVVRLAAKVKSTTETLITGTRIAKPSKRPAKAGNTKPTAFAAPVLVGIMLVTAERARRISL